MQLHTGRTVEENFTFDMVQTKGNFVEALTLQNLLMHFVVTRGVAALATGCEHNDFTAGCASSRIQRKSAVL